jgi:hypothetical protein
MSKKNLLNESTVRQFMKYANIQRLSDNFVNETYGIEEAEEPLEEVEEPLEESEEPLEEAEEPLEEATAEELEFGAEEHAAELEAGEEEMADLEAGEEEAEALDGGTIDIEQFMAAFEQALEQVTGEEVAVDTEADLEGEELPGDEGPEDMALGGEEEEEVLEDMNTIDEDEIVQETVRRVTARLKGMQESDKLAEALTDRIMNQITRSRSRK